MLTLRLPSLLGAVRGRCAASRARRGGRVLPGGGRPGRRACAGTIAHASAHVVKGAGARSRMAPTASADAGSNARAPILRAHASATLGALARARTGGACACGASAGHAARRCVGARVLARVGCGRLLRAPASAHQLATSPFPTSATTKCEAVSDSSERRRRRTRQRHPRSPPVPPRSVRQRAAPPSAGVGTPNRDLDVPTRATTKCEGACGSSERRRRRSDQRPPRSPPAPPRSALGACAAKLRSKIFIMYNKIT